MNKVWQLQEAKNRFSEVVEEALRKGPQTVTRHGEEAVVVLSVEDYRKLTKPSIGLVDFFRHSPLKGVKLDLARSKELSREVSL
jgi:prevent-host-death family protein